MVPVYTVIHTVIDDGIYARMNPCHHMERIPGNLAPDLMSNEALLQGPLVQENEWENGWPSDIPASIQDNIEASAVSPTGVCISFPSAEYKAVGTAHPESVVNNSHEEDLPVTHPSESKSMNQTAFSWSLPPANTQYIPTKSILRGSEGSWTSSVTLNEDPRDSIIDRVDTNCNWNQEGVSINAPFPLDHGDRRARVRVTSEFSVPSALPGLHPTPTVARYQEQRASRKMMPRRSPKLWNGPIAVSPRLSLQPDEKSEAPEGRYWCGICGRNYIQQRGVTRHRRDVHEISLCMHCRNFKWHRRHQLREHLEEQHPDVHLSATLDEITKTRRKATKIKTDSRRQRASLVIEHARTEHSTESWPLRSMWLPPAVAGWRSRTQSASESKSSQVSSTIPF